MADNPKDIGENKLQSVETKKNRPSIISQCKIAFLLIVHNIAIENGHRNSYLPINKWWISKVFCVLTRGYLH